MKYYFQKQKQLQYITWNWQNTFGGKNKLYLNLPLAFTFF